MVRWRRRLAASLFLPAVVLASCDDARGLGPQAGTLRLSVAAAQSVSSRNLGADSVSLTTGGCLVLPYIAVQSSGPIVYPGGGEWLCIAVIRRFTLAPGAERAETLLVRGSASALAAYPPVGLPPGHYLIYATFSTAKLSLRSESVPFTVQ